MKGRSNRRHEFFMAAVTSLLKQPLNNGTLLHRENLLNPSSASLGSNCNFPAVRFTVAVIG
ncbi:hypothetical protein J4464_00840 [Candidatus Woesearchaeota archaeon]|nr:hypothetical protein [Candidatus Woesearchaeota archaeon]